MGTKTKESRGRERTKGESLRGFAKLSMTESARRRTTGILQIGIPISF
jgi:hypothetical protein